MLLIKKSDNVKTFNTVYDISFENNVGGSVIIIVSNATISENTAADLGGMVYLPNSSGSLTYIGDNIF